MNPVTAAENATSAMIQSGAMGAVAVLFAVMLVILWRDAKQTTSGLLRKLEEVQQQRVEDAQAVQQQMLEVIRQCTASLVAVTNTLEQQRQAMYELRDSFRSMGNDMKALGEDLRDLGKQPPKR